MSDQGLRRLFQERVDDLAPVDLASGAWDRAVRTRRRRAAVVAGAVAVAGLLVVGGVVAVTRGGEDTSEPAPPAESTSTTPSETSNATAGAERAGTYAGVPVWWVPTTADEHRLPVLSGSRLPTTIDLAPDAPDLPVGTYPVAVFEVTDSEGSDRVVAVASDGTSYSLDTSGLEPATDPAGNDLPTVSHHSLASDGHHAFFVQNDSLAVYDFDDGSWTSIATQVQVAELAEWDGPTSIRVPDSTGIEPAWTIYSADGDRLGMSNGGSAFAPPRRDDVGYGALRSFGSSSARAYFLGGPVADPGGLDHLSLDAVVADVSGRRGMLVVPAEGGGGRFDACCPVAGWFGLETVVFESRWVDARILAWRVGTSELLRVSDITGWESGLESYIASFADLAA